MISARALDSSAFKPNPSLGKVSRMDMLPSVTASEARPLRWLESEERAQPPANELKTAQTRLRVPRNMKAVRPKNK